MSLARAKSYGKGIGKDAIEKRIEDNGTLCKKAFPTNCGITSNGIYLSRMPDKRTDDEGWR